MSGYKTSEHQGGIRSGEGNGTESDLSPLPAAFLPLSAEQGQPGTANEDVLSSLIAKGLRDQTKNSWSAADYNNLACAYFWFNREEGSPYAIEYFEQALTLLAATPTSEEAKTITSNLKLVKAPSRAG